MFSHENLQQFPIRNSAVLSLSAFSFGSLPPADSGRPRLPGGLGTTASYLPARPASRASGQITPTVIKCTLQPSLPPLILCVEPTTEET